MKLIIQRVNRAKVSTGGKVVGEIGKGLFVLVGVKNGDTIDQAEALAQKLLKLRVMADSEDKMNLSVLDAKAEFLLVSQFTLYADASGGNRPSFIDAAPPSDAQKIYDYFVIKIKGSGTKTETGSFGNYMKIETELDGPVTIILESN